MDVDDVHRAKGKRLVSWSSFTVVVVLVLPGEEEVVVWSGCLWLCSFIAVPLLLQLVSFHSVYQQLFYRVLSWFLRCRLFRMRKVAERVKLVWNYLWRVICSLGFICFGSTPSVCYQLTSDSQFCIIISSSMPLVFHSANYDWIAFDFKLIQKWPPINYINQSLAH